MRLTLLLLALALPLSAQTRLETLRAELLALNHEIQKELALEKLQSVKLFVLEDALLMAKGFGVKADTTDGNYVQIVLPDSLAREAMLSLREEGDRGIPFILTSDPLVIRIHGNRLKRAAMALKAGL